MSRLDVNRRGGGRRRLGWELEVVTAERAEVGEGPLFDNAAGQIWWVDLLAGLVHRSDPSSGETSTFGTDRHVGAVALVEGGGLLLADATGFAFVGRDGDIVERIAFLPDGHRMNDAKVDPAGSCVAGSNEMGFAHGEGALWVLGRDRRVRCLLEGLTLPNGLGWSPDGAEFYLADSEQGWLHAWRYDAGRGELAAEREVARFSCPGEVPDGLCVDDEGAIWVALWGGGRVERYAPDGELLAILETPVCQPSSCAFGGPGGDDLFVTSARRGLEPSSALDGALLRVRATGRRGVPVPAYGGRPR